MSRSAFPFRAADGLDPELIRYLDKIGTPLTSVSDLSASPTNAEIATAFNALLAAMRAAAKMDS